MTFSSSSQPILHQDLKQAKKYGLVLFAVVIVLGGAALLCRWVWWRTDVCWNLRGLQRTVPQDYLRDKSKNCVPSLKQEELCIDIDGKGKKIPFGKQKDAKGRCIPIPPPCTIQEQRSTNGTCVPIPEPKEVHLDHSWGDKTPLLEKQNDTSGKNTQNTQNTQSSPSHTSIYKKSKIFPLKKQPTATTELMQKSRPEELCIDDDKVNKKIPLGKQRNKEGHCVLIEKSTPIQTPYHPTPQQVLRWDAECGGSDLERALCIEKCRHDLSGRLQCLEDYGRVP